MANGKAAGVQMGAYHYAEPGTNSPSTEADYFWNTAGSYILADGKTLMPMLDMEVFNGHVGATSYSEWAQRAIKGSASVDFTLLPGGHRSGARHAYPRSTPVGVLWTATHLSNHE